MSRQPEGPPPPPVVQRLRVRYAKRGPLRFTSHRDVARAFERAIRRAALPIAFSAGFSPHPKLSYVGAAPTGAASEAEYLEIGLAEAADPDRVRTALDAALPPGIDVLAVVDAADSPAKTLAELVDGSRWRIELPGVDPVAARVAVDALLAAAQAPVQRATKEGVRTIDVRGALAAVHVMAGGPAADAADAAAADAADPPGALTCTNSDVPAVACATLEVVVRHATPAVRPDDIVTALHTVGALTTPVTPVVTRLAQGLIDAASPEDAERLIDPFGERAGHGLPRSPVG